MDGIRTALGLGTVVLVGMGLVWVGGLLRAADDAGGAVLKTIRDIGEIAEKPVEGGVGVAKNAWDGFLKLTDMKLRPAKK